jgi:hypothetical protein
MSEPSTKLDLCVRLRELAGMGPTGPLTTLNQIGELKRCVDWIDGAWTTIQQDHNWSFLWERADLTVLANTNSLAGTIPAVRYKKRTTFNGVTRMTYREWVDFDEDYPDHLIVAGTPTVWSIAPDKAFVVNAKPTANTTFKVQRYRNPVAMAADADEPGLPIEHRMVIVYKALMLYSNFEEAGVTRETSRREFDRHMRALGAHELPDLMPGAPLL